MKPTLDTLIQMSLKGQITSTAHILQLFEIEPEVTEHGTVTKRQQKINALANTVLAILSAEAARVAKGENPQLTLF